MKTEFQAKFLQHLNQKKQDKGFTLIELLVVVIIIGILAAVALPSLLSQTNKAKQAEAKQNAGAMNRAQQAYFLEKGAFASQVTLLGLGIATQTTNYKYEIPDAATNLTQVNNQATPLTQNLKGYVGFTWSEEQDVGGGAKESITKAQLCESTQVTTTAITGDKTTNCAGHKIVQ